MTSHLVQMPLVGKMMEELVAALPPLGNSKVSDRVAGNRVIAAHEGVRPAGRGWSGHHGST